MLEKGLDGQSLFSLVWIHGFKLGSGMMRRQKKKTYRILSWNVCTEGYRKGPVAIEMLDFWTWETSMEKC